MVQIRLNVVILKYFVLCLLAAYYLRHEVLTLQPLIGVGCNLPLHLDIRPSIRINLYFTGQLNLFCYQEKIHQKDDLAMTSTIEGYYETHALEVYH